MATLLTQEGVQYPVVASGIINWDDVYDGVALSTVAAHVINLAKIPANAIVMSGGIQTLTVFATTGTCTIDIGDDNPTADPNRYTQAGAIDLEAAGADFTVLPTATTLAFRTTTLSNITATLTVGTAALTAGQLAWWIQYAVIGGVPGRQHENLG